MHIQSGIDNIYNILSTTLLRMPFFPVWQTRLNEDKQSIESMNTSSYKSVQGFFGSESACYFCTVVNNKISVSSIRRSTINLLFWYAVFILRMCVTKSARQSYLRLNFGLTRLKTPFPIVDRKFL